MFFIRSYGKSRADKALRGNRSEHDDLGVLRLLQPRQFDRSGPFAREDQRRQ